MRSSQGQSFKIIFFDIERKLQALAVDGNHLCFRFAEGQDDPLRLGLVLFVEKANGELGARRLSSW